MAITNWTNLVSGVSLQTEMKKRKNQYVEKNNRTLAPGRSQVNLIRAQKKEHSRKPYEFVSVIEKCSPGPYIELFARGIRDGWSLWGNQADENYAPTWNTYANNSSVEERKE